MFIVIDVFNKDYPSIILNEEGDPKVFTNKDDAQAEADDCQNAIVVEY